MSKTIVGLFIEYFCKLLITDWIPKMGFSGTQKQPKMGFQESSTLSKIIEYGKNLPKDPPPSKHFGGN